MQIWEISYSSYADCYFWEQEIKRKAEEAYRKKLLYALHMALDEYKKTYPDGYALIMEYYGSDKKITFKELGERHSIAKSTMHEKFSRHMARLQKIAIRILNDLTANDS